MREGLHDGLRVGLSVGVAALIGVGLYFGTSLHEWVVGLAAIVVFGVLIVAIPRRKEAHEIMVAPGVSLADLRTVEREGRELLDRVARSLGAIPARDPAHETVQNIMGAIQSIYGQFEKDPADIGQAGPFRDSHVVKAVELIETYARLVSDTLLDERGRGYVDRCRERFDGIETAFIAQYNAMLRHDVAALEQAGRNLDASLRLEHGLEAVRSRK